jgi:catechol 2,3-dioxygenase-like lactoylglutathione lyase family enzyme
MFNHIMVGVNDLEASKRFYDAVFAAMGVGPGIAGKSRYYYRSATGTLGIITPINGKAATHANGGTIGLTMQSQEEVDAFHAAAVANGGTTCEDPPGLREGPSGKMYLAYVRDPDGTKFCAVYRYPK